MTRKPRSHVRILINRAYAIIIRCKLFFSLAESPPRDLLKSAYKLWSAHTQCRPIVLGFSVWLQIIFCPCVDGRSLRSPSLKNKLGDRIIKQLVNSVIAKYRDLSLSRRSIICRCLRLREITDLLATDKSRYFAQPVNFVQ